MCNADSTLLLVNVFADGWEIGHKMGSKSDKIAVMQFLSKNSSYYEKEELLVYQLVYHTVNKDHFLLLEAKKRNRRREKRQEEIALRTSK